MSMGDSFVSGFSAMTDAKAKKKAAELEQKRLDFEVEQKKKDADRMASQFKTRIDFEADQASLERQFKTGERVGSQNWHSGESAADRATRMAALDKELRSRSDLQSAEQTFNAPEKNARVRSLDAQATAMTAKDPNLATVEQPLDPMNPAGGKASFRVPIDQLGKMGPQEKYQSPYASAIADTEKELVAQQTEMASGDNRTGLFNMTSRGGIAADANKKLLRLKALELQDMVQKGAISQEEADTRAKKLLPQ